MTPHSRFYRSDHELIMAVMANVTMTSATAVTGRQKRSCGFRPGKPYAGGKFTGNRLAGKVYHNMRAIARTIATITNPERELSEWSVKQFVSHAIGLIHRDLPNAHKLKQLRSHKTSNDYGCPPKDVPAMWNAFLEKVQAELDGPELEQLCAWVEYELRFRLHPLADGSGRLATVLTAWIMCRAGRAIPSYAYWQRSELHAKLRASYEEFREYYLWVCFGNSEEVSHVGGNPRKAAAA